jgi:hypothetical protein
MSIHDRLNEIERRAAMTTDLSFDRFCRSGWSIAEWFHRLAKINPADARRFAGEFITIDPNEDDESFMEFLANVPESYDPPMPPGSLPSCPINGIPESNWPGQIESGPRLSKTDLPISEDHHV